MIVKNISKSKLLQGDILEQLRFALAADPIAFRKAFSANGINVEEDEDLQTLAQLSITGKDKAGTKVGDRIILFDTVKILNSYDISHRLLNQSGIKLID